MTVRELVSSYTLRIKTGRAAERRFRKVAPHRSPISSNRRYLQGQAELRQLLPGPLQYGRVPSMQVVAIVEQTLAGKSNSLGALNDDCRKNGRPIVVFCNHKMGSFAVREQARG